MKYFIYSLIGLALGLLELSLSWHLGPFTIHIYAVLIGSLALILAREARFGSITLIAGTLTLDVFSPYRFGLFLLLAMIILYGLNLLLSRSFETTNPLIILGIFLVSLFLFQIIELVMGGQIISFLANDLINTFFGTAITYLVMRYVPSSKEAIRISDDVNFRRL
jgi:hypothetical protein